MVSRYHWTLDYILWGITWSNAQLMIADSMRIKYNKEGGNDEEVMDLSNPIHVAKLQQMANNQYK